MVDSIHTGRVYREAGESLAPAEVSSTYRCPIELSPNGRSFLFLQGNVSRFFERLGTALLGQGHVVHKVNFNGGDKLFWRLPGAIDFSGTLEEWPSRFGQILTEYRVTDIILFGDCRPIHRGAVEIAKARQVRVFVLEEGYLRPDYITIERGGVNGFTSLPRTPEAFLELAESLPEPEAGPRIHNSFARRAGEDVAYHVARVAMHVRYPHYRFHAPIDPFVEYAGWIKRFVTGYVARQRSRSVLPLTQDGSRYYLMPLQLDSDYQVRVHSPFERLRPALEQVIRSFGTNAPLGTFLIIKSHPLDAGLCNWRAVIAEIAESAGVAQRVRYIDHKDLSGLIRRSQGVVTINSTVGSVALQLNRPLIALGHAVYNIEGLTFQRGLDRFWTEGEPPHPDVYAAFRRVLIHRSLVHGSFFSRRGVACAVNGVAARLEAEGQSDEEGRVGRVTIWSPVA